MTSNTPGPAQAAPAPPMFSYAQAAKGRAAAAATATATSPNPSNQPISTTSIPVKDSNSAVNTPSTSVNGTTTTSEGGDRSINGVHDSTAKSDSSGAGLDSESKSTTLVNFGSIPASPSYGTTSTSTLPKEEDLTLAAGAPSESVWDKKPQQTNGSEKAVDSPEGRRSKKGKKQKIAEKEKEAELEAEKKKEEEKKQRESLVAAPPPAVNIWQQRKEAQALKVKPSPLITQASQPSFEPTTSNDATAKSSDSKKRNKPLVAEEGDKAGSTGQTGGAKDTSSTNKGQKKTAEGTSKGKEEPANKRAGPRGSRVSEKDEQSVTSQLPPPVEDSISWPTPETALEEEKRKAIEKERADKEKDERDEPASNKPRPKEKWVAVPFVPSVNFNTPVPPRGGRGRGGARGGRDSTGRGGHASTGGSGGDRTNNGSANTANTAGEPENRGRGGSTATRATSLPPNSSKRSSSNTRAQGKTSNGPNAEKSKSGQTNGPIKNESSSNADTQRTSSGGQTDQSLSNPQTGPDNSMNPKADFVIDYENNLRSAGGDGKSESTKVADQSKDGTYVKDSTQARDGRADRGRGGFRGRGGHNHFTNGQLPQPQLGFTNGHGQPPNGYLARQNSNPYSPSLQQAPFNNQYAQQPASRGRGGSRSQSIPNNGIYGRFPPNISSQMAPLSTANAMYEYQQPPLQSMSPGAYPNYDSYPLLAMVTMQLEYYFSIDNLCKDIYLRKHMDSQGFVFLPFIAGFKRIQALTPDIDLLRFACQESALIEVIKGEDGVVRLRRKDGWEKWVLGMDERDESVRTAGPTYHQRFDSRSQQAQQLSMMQGYPAMPSPAFSPNGTESSFQAVYGNGSSIAPIMNGNGNHHHPETPLSAAVPDFAPAIPAINGTADTLEEETTFGDEDVANLKLVFASPKSQDGTKDALPFHNPSSRTFSNGSIDGRSIAEELHDEPRQSRGLTNGSRASEM
jgi:la-related protein 1